MAQGEQEECHRGEDEMEDRDSEAQKIADNVGEKRKEVYGGERGA